jgi:hypothetical protein
MASSLPVRNETTETKTLDLVGDRRMGICSEKSLCTQVIEIKQLLPAVGREPKMRFVAGDPSLPQHWKSPQKPQEKADAPRKRARERSAIASYADRSAPLVAKFDRSFLQWWAATNRGYPVFFATIVTTLSSRSCCWVRASKFGSVRWTRWHFGSQPSRKTIPPLRRCDAYAGRPEPCGR